MHCLHHALSTASSSTVVLLAVPALPCQLLHGRCCCCVPACHTALRLSRCDSDWCFWHHQPSQQRAGHPLPSASHRLNFEGNTRGHDGDGLVGACMHMHTHMNAHVHAWTHTHEHEPMQAHPAPAPVPMPAPMCISKQVCTHAHMCTCMCDILAAMLPR